MFYLYANGNEFRRTIYFTWHRNKIWHSNELYPLVQAVITCICAKTLALQQVLYLAFVYTWQPMHWYFHVSLKSVCSREKTASFFSALFKAFVKIGQILLTSDIYIEKAHDVDFRILNKLPEIVWHRYI